MNALGVPFQIWVHQGMAFLIIFKAFGGPFHFWVHPEMVVLIIFKAFGGSFLFLPGKGFFNHVSSFWGFPSKAGFIRERLFLIIFKAFRGSLQRGFITERLSFHIYSFWGFPLKLLGFIREWLF